MKPFPQEQSENFKFIPSTSNFMRSVAANKKTTDNVVVVKKMKDYGNEPAFNEKAKNAITFIKKHGLPRKSSRNK